MNTRLLARGTLTGVLVSAAKLGLQLVAVPLMARLVGPADYGLFGLAMPVVSFCLLLAEGGFGISLAREPEENKEVWSTATLFLLAFGVGLCVVLIAWSFIQASLANQPKLPPILIVLSICPILLALTVPPNARLIRQARIGMGSVLDLTAMLAGIGVAVGLAWSGAGVWGLVAQPVVYWTCKAILMNVVSPTLPQLRFAPKYLTPHLKAGGIILGAKFVETGGRAIEASIISRQLGAEMLGAYTFAYQLPRFLTETLGNALWSMLYVYTVRSESAGGLTKTYHLTLRVFALAMFPAGTLMSVMAQPLLHGLLGTRWDAAVVVLQVLLISQAFSSISGIASAVLYGKGKPEIFLRIWTEGVALRVLVVGTGSFGGLPWVAIGLGAVDLYLCLRAIFSLRVVIENCVQTAMRAILMPILLSALSGVICWALGRSQIFDPFFPALVVAILCMAISFLCYLLLLAAFERHKLIEEFQTIYQLLRR